MAARGQVNAQLNGIRDVPTQYILKAIFQYVMTTLTFGRATNQNNASSVPSDNFAGGFFTATTPSSANTEFAVPHNFGRAPYLCIPVLPLDQVNAQIVPVTVSRAADSVNVYLKSSTVSAAVFFYLEG